MMRKLKPGFMFIELLLVLAVTMFLAFTVFKLYFKGPAIDKETQKVIAEQGAGIDTTSYRSTIESAKNKLDDIQKKHFDELNKME